MIPAFDPITNALPAGIHESDWALWRQRQAAGPPGWDASGAPLAGQGAFSTLPRVERSDAEISYQYTARPSGRFACSEPSHVVDLGQSDVRWRLNGAKGKLSENGARFARLFFLDSQRKPRTCGGGTCPCVQVSRCPTGRFAQGGPGDRSAP